jgi:hypothetical protein
MNRPYCRQIARLSTFRTNELERTVDYVFSSIKNELKSFCASDSGAVTVDWVVLTAGLVGLGLATTAVVSNGLGNSSSDIASTVSDYEIVTSSDAPAATLTSWIPLNPGAVDANIAWMQAFEDQQLLDHMNNQAQFADVQAGAGHPTEAYHDEYFIALNEAESRGLIDG